MDPDYRPTGTEERDVFGFRLEQERNSRPINAELFRADEGSVAEAVLETAIVGTTALKYTQSNSVGIAFEGQVIGMAGRSAVANSRHTDRVRQG